MDNEQNGVVWRKGSDTMNNSDDDAWDDTAVIKAYDKAVATLRSTMNNSSYQVTENNKKQNKKEKQKKKKSVKNGNKKWKPGRKCLAIFEDDGLYYPATILSISDHDQTASVQYDYYMNEDEVSLGKLLPLENKFQMEVVTNITNVDDSETKSIKEEEKSINGNEEVQRSDVEVFSGWRVSDICYILNEKKGTYQKAVINSFTSSDLCQVTLIKSHQKREVKITQLHSTIPTHPDQTSHRRKSRSPHSQPSHHQPSNQKFPWHLPDFDMHVPPPPPPLFMDIPGFPSLSLFGMDVPPWQKECTNNSTTHSHSKLPSCPPLPVIPKDVISGNEEALANMLMSWYMSGYHTGYYQGIQKNQQTINEKKRNEGKRWRKQTSN